jgi:hypothetical protein
VRRRFSGRVVSRTPRATAAGVRDSRAVTLSKQVYERLARRLAEFGAPEFEPRVGAVGVGLAAV